MIDFRSQLDKCVYEAINDHAYLLKDVKRSYEKVQIERVLRREWSHSSDDLLVLSRLLHDYYKRQVG